MSPSAPATTNEDRTVAILAYLTLIGFIVAVVMHGNKKTELGTYHLRQALGLMIASVVLSVAIMILSVIPIIQLLTFVVGPIAWLAIFALWIMGLIAAVNGQKKPIPVVGSQFEQWFATAFA